MADIEHEDTYTIKNNAGMIGVRVRVLGGHSGAWVVTIDDMPVSPQTDGFVTLGLGSLVRGREVVVTTLMTKVSGGRKFLVEHEVREVAAGGGITTLLEVKGDFGTKNTSEVEETISFS
jgi:hypothetical protein